MKFLFPFLVSACFLSASAQRTVGLLSADTSRNFKGYNLIYPDRQPNVYLLDNAGHIVHTWTDSSNSQPGNAVQLLKDGSILKTKKLQRGGKTHTLVEKRDWDNILLWSFSLNDSFYKLHHDIEPLPNGNILMLCLEKKTAAQAIAKGKDPTDINAGEIWTDKIIEVQPIGVNGYKIAWEWHVWDHLVQDIDSAKPNFGHPAEFTQKIDINYAGKTPGPSWASLNSIGYNIALDQVVVSCPDFNEIWIIDHTTNTSQAASDYGGSSWIGGELMFRWGNPAAYGSGTSSDQKLFAPNDIQWIGKTWKEKDFGKLIVFNNRVGPDYSTVNVLFPTIDTYLWEYQKVSNTELFLPRKFEWTYQMPDSTDMYSSDLSSVQRLDNGNTLICAAETGYSLEITPDSQVVWAYKTPIKSGARARQGDLLQRFDNTTPGIIRYAADFPAFTGRDLSPQNFLELQPDTLTGIEKSSVLQDIRIYPNPAVSDIRVESPGLAISELTIYSVQGQVLWDKQYDGEQDVHINIAHLPAGLYFLSINGNALVRALEIRN